MNGSDRPRNELDARQLRVFVALVDRGSVTGAARALGLAQSTASEQLAALERALGTAIVGRRRGRGVELTPAGETLLPHARKLLAALDEARSAVVRTDPLANAELKVVANESISTYLLPHALDGLRERWPNTAFAVTIGTCDIVRAGVAAGHFDVGLLLEADRTPRAAAPRPATGSRPAKLLTLFSGRAHPLSGAGRRAVARRELVAYPVFSSDASGDFPALLHAFFFADGLPGPRLESAGTIEAVKRTVAPSPVALGVLPTYAVEEELRRGDLCAIVVRPALPRLHLVVLQSSSRAPHPAASALAAALGDPGREPCAARC